MPNTRLSPRSAGLLAGIVALATACSGGESVSPPAPSRLEILTSPGASAASGVPLAPQPVLQLLDASGAAVASRGVLVTASLASGGGSLEGATGVRTDQDGRAAFTDLAIRGATGPRTLRFSATGLSAAISGTISLGPGPATVAVVSAGNNQTAAAGTAVAIAPAVRVTDQSDNPVPGVSVSFAVTQGGGTVTGPSPVTDANGVAAVSQWVLGTAVGSNALTATVAGVATPLTVTATAVVGPAAQIAIVEGDGQSATIGGTVPLAPAVKVTDAAGNAVAGVAITFTPATGGGSVTGGTGITDAAGVARVGGWRLGLTPGANTLAAARQGASTATFTATGTDFQVTGVAAGGAFACGITAAGLRCWGDNSFGQFGNGGVAPDSVPSAAAGNLVLTQVSTGAGHACGLTAGGTAWCWGANNTGQLGDGTLTPRAAPVAVAGGLSFKQISAGTNHTCALRTDGAAYCWGSNANGRLGTGGTASSAAPVAVAGGFTWLSIRAGASHTCAVRNDDAVYCWGSNTNGRIGDGTTTDRTIPTVLSGGGAWSAVAVGGSHSCALNQAGVAYCWGNGGSGQLGGGTAVTQSLVPIAVAGATTFSAIVAATAHTCALAADGAAWCWGSNGSGRLGDGTTAPNRPLPTAVSGGLLLAEISAGNEHTCGRSIAGSAICWGRNAEGQVGDGSTSARNYPVGVKSP